MSAFLSKQQLTELIRAGDFAGLFVQLGWDREGLPNEPLVLELNDGGRFPIMRVAEKRGFVVCVCDAGDNYPSAQSERRRLVKALAGHHYEHLLIICGGGRQCWMVAIRPQNRPLRTVEVEWREGRDIQPLMEKLDGMLFDISEEEKLGITDVVDKIRTAFMEGADTVTKKFYREFQTALTAFSEFIDGISERVSREWYAALMLNRLMFIYFIQKKRFLDGDPDYLQNRLKQTKEKYGADQFHDRFYRHFLRRLFSEGLGTPESQRDPQLKALLGQVPYLNGGLFDLHEIERHNEDISIPDRAFENLFAFFGQYNWRLDTRPTASGKDINPDVIGYIFEKYINDRAAMGAYYTQEDITGYISRNTIIPFLLNRAKDKCQNAFDAHNGIWRFLRENPDNYIYDAVKKGCDLADAQIPANIRRGMDTGQPGLLERRKDWNTPTDEAFALPTEIWRETLARRKRYFALKAKIANGEVRQIDDLITHNLDIERFASDALRHYEGSDFIAAFYNAIAGTAGMEEGLRSNQQHQRGITVLDPACGSGAFLFAALNILEPLYETCIERMREFVEDDDRLREQGKRKGAKKHPQFRKVLQSIETHQNEKYWIYKTIILNNLYGVDLMKEAAEIAKLRLFLKLAAEAEYDSGKDNLGLEPLPDIDFNIRSGNSLVGFASMAQFEKALAPGKGQQQIEFSGGLLAEIREEAALVQKAHNAFKQAQDRGGESYRRAKTDLNTHLAALNDKMNRYLARQYGKDDTTKAEYKQWLKTHQPFHWLAEFYGIIEEDGGFDVVIGNPPYVEYKEVKETYTVKDYMTESCGNLYAMFVERATQIHADNSRFGMIVPSSVTCTDNYIPVQDILYGMNSLYVSSYSDQRGKLFDIPHPRLSIVLYRSGSMPDFERKVFATAYHKLDTRENLFNLITYCDARSVIRPGRVPRFCCELEKLILEKIFKNASIKEYMYGKTYKAYYTRKISWFLQVTDFPPKIYDGNNNLRYPSELKIALFDTASLAKRYFVALNSSLFYWFVITGSDCRNLNRRETDNFPISIDANSLTELDEISKELSANLKDNSVYRRMTFKKSKPPQNKLNIQCLYPKKSKTILDKIDITLGKHYGFTEEELDYIINYDIKYRMGITNE